VLYNPLLLPSKFSVPHFLHTYFRSLSCSCVVTPLPFPSSSTSKLNLASFSSLACSF
jgi:hypothetical protein